MINLTIWKLFSLGQKSQKASLIQKKEKPNGINGIITN